MGDGIRKDAQTCHYKQLKVRDSDVNFKSLVRVRGSDLKNLTVDQLLVEFSGLNCFFFFFFK